MKYNIILSIYVGGTRAQSCIIFMSGKELVENFIHDYTIYNKYFFRRSFFLFSPSPNMEGIKDVLFYKFRRPMIGQNCSAMCTNNSGHRDVLSNKWRKAPRVSRGLLSRPTSLEQSKRQGLFFVIAWW